MSCQYCKKFQEAELRENNRNGKGAIIYQTRYCPSKDNMFDKHNKRCEHFSAATIFWCDIFICWKDITACLSSQKHESIGCKTCKQKKAINDFAVPKPVLRKRAEAEVKSIILKKRRTL